MRIWRTNDSTENLCDTCPMCIADCDGESLEFGDGTGNDNVIQCDAYSGRGTPNMEIGQIALKETKDE